MLDSVLSTEIVRTTTTFSCKTVQKDVVDFLKNQFRNKFKIFVGCLKKEIKAQVNVKSGLSLGSCAWPPLPLPEQL